MISLHSSFNALVPTLLNLNFLPNLLRLPKPRSYNSVNFCFNPIFSDTHKLFDEIPHRSVFLLNSKCSLSHIASHERSVELQVPRQVFHDVFSWTAGISSFTKNNQQEQAIGLFKSMLLHAQRPNYVTVLSVIRAVGAINSQGMTRAIHGFVIKLGFESEVSIATALLGLYSIHDMMTVWQIFDQVEVKDLVLWSALVTACLKNGKFIDAIYVFREMQGFGLEPNHVSILSVLPACADLGALSLGKQIHGFSIKREFYSVTNLQNSLVDMYAKCRSLKCSVLVFDRLQNKDLISWNTMICGCMENGYPKKALHLFYNMLNSCFQPDETTVRNALMACSQAEDVQFGFGLHCYVLKAGLQDSISVGTALLRMYADFGNVASARILFDGLNRKDIIAWSAMTSVYAQSGHPFLALEMFKQMQLANEKPNEITLVSLLQACSSMKPQEHWKSIHGHVIRFGYSSNEFITSALIDLYCKFGQLSQGKALFDKIPHKDIICWSSMINGYGINGYGEKALETFSNMLDSGKKPNEVVFISVLSACSHCGLEDEGWECFYSMEENFGIIPTLPHYSCMVDLLSRKGKIKEAIGFIKKMPLEPDSSIWGALLAGCRTGSGDIEVAEFAAERLFSLDSENTSYYVILSNLYAEHGKPSYYVVIQCGNQELRSKITSGEHKKALWNEKFAFKFPFSDWQNMAHLKLKIMDTSRFSDGNFIGETIIHLGGVITEGSDKGFVELKPAPYNVVLEDDRYKGEIKIGLKFIKTVDVQAEKRECVNLENKSLRMIAHLDLIRTVEV
ncbi:C2 calcium-dependent membrane targeting [Macleaya cordata]|uniref:C2 calcium-dependent membrane targeting n=1 Tax=Macleaya cordata TaxID=56857 RepID=A0A200QU71_MACCD|nr:C2 calcium-dependent membrane targeting [Macleaya cordata]